ncbi:MAG: PEP-CTERM sorting domain-containing protein [Steroidobacteraceae bacterium]
MNLKNLLISGALAATTFGVATSAFAVPTGTAGTIGTNVPGTGINDFVALNPALWAPNGAGVQGYFGAQLWITPAGLFTTDNTGPFAATPASVQIEIFGREAGQGNVFNYNAVSFGFCPGTGFRGAGDPPSGAYPNFVTVEGGGLLDFNFNTSTNPCGGAATASVSNTVLGQNAGNSAPNSGLPSFFTSFNDSFATSGNQVWLFLDDGGGNLNSTTKDDDNHDDFVVRLTVLSIPEPATLGLLGMGLIGLGLARRRKQTA